MDIFTENILSPFNKTNYIRLPDCPVVEDFELLGRGNEEINDETNGIIVLDEASKYFNAREWQDKGRQKVIDWLIHSGKLGWDVYYQMQGLSQLDKQIRSTQVEYHIAVKNTAKWPIPFVTQISAIFGFKITLPKMHIGVYRQGVERDSLLVMRKFYKAQDLYNAYDTRQIFLDRDHPNANGIYTVLSNWYTKGRYIEKEAPSKLIRFIFGIIGYNWTEKAYQRAIEKMNRPPVKKHPLAEKLQKLDPDQRTRLFNALEQKGAFNA